MHPWCNPTSSRCRVLFVRGWIRFPSVPMRIFVPKFTGDIGSSSLLVSGTASACPAPCTPRPCRRHTAGRPEGWPGGHVLASVRLLCCGRLAWPLLLFWSVFNICVTFSCHFGLSVVVEGQPSGGGPGLGVAHGAGQCAGSAACTLTHVETASVPSSTLRVLSESGHPRPALPTLHDAVSYPLSLCPSLRSCW